MKNLLPLSYLLLLSLTVNAQTGQWRDYPAYSEPQQIQQSSENSVFVMASGGLYQYNPHDESITTYSKVKGLSDTGISHIAWSKKAKRLLLVYANSNMDLLTEQGDVTSLPDLYNKSTTLDKTVNNVWLDGNEALLATGFGVVRVDMAQGMISETYNIGVEIKKVTRITKTQAKDYMPAGIYAQENNGTTHFGDESKALDNPNNWIIRGGIDGVWYEPDKTAWNMWIEKVRTLSPGGPRYNNFGFMVFNNGRLLSSDNGYNPVIGDMYWPANPQEYYPDEDEWLIYDDIEDSLMSDLRYIDMMTLVEDPLKPGHVYGGNRSAIMEYQDGHVVNRFTPDNTPELLWRFDPKQNRYYKRMLLFETMAYDKEGRLWMLNSATGDISLGKGNQLLMLDREGQWHDYSSELPEATDEVAYRNLLLDSRGLLWFNNMHWSNPQTFCFNPQTGKIIKTIGNDVVNEDGTALAYYNRYSLTEDLEGNIWIGTSMGPVQVDAQYCGANVASVPYLTQVKVSRNDGSGLADYLMAGASVSSIVVDGAGRKWIGTNGAGLYLISADCQQQLEHFTQDNSPLISDEVRCLAIDNTSGILYIGTGKGLCSYHTDATTAVATMKGDELVAYPNPVTPDYTGLITITGFSMDADVKILNSAGRLICQGRSNGGTFTWNGCDSRGRRVASGVYMITAATSEGKKGAVGKVAIVR